MKTLKFNFGLLLVTSAFLVLINSCSKDEQLSPVQPNTTIEKQTSAEIDLMLPSSDLANASVLEKATLDVEFFITEKTVPEDEILNIELNEQTYTFCCIGKKVTDYTKFLNSLKLTRDQMIRLKTAINDYQLCRKELNVMIKKIQIEILTKANEQRTSLLRQYKAGEITGQQLKSALESLHQRTQNALKERLSKLNVNEYLKRCYRSFMENVKLILDRSQWQKWVDWHTKRNTTGTKK